jgi:outer membrane protein assembly factor BamB
MIGNARGRRLLSALLVATAFTLPAAAPAGGEPRGADPATAYRWLDRYDGPGADNDYALDTAITPDGQTAVVTGTSTNADGNLDYATIAYDVATGSRRWTARYDGMHVGPDEARALAISPDGTTVFVTGDSSYDYATIAYDLATGARLWLRRYDGPIAGNDVAYSIAVTPDGATVVVTGASDGPGMFSSVAPDYATIAYDAATGARRWVRRYAGAALRADQASSVAASTDSATVVVTGYSENASASADAVTVAYDSLTGSVRWHALYDSPLHGYDTGFAASYTPDGSRVVVTGSGFTSTGDYLTIMYDAASGTPLWAKGLDGPVGGRDHGNSVAVSPDGSEVVVTGFSQGSDTLPNLSDLLTVAYDAATGDQRWAKRYDAPAHDMDDGAGVAFTPDGAGVVVTGQSFQAGNDVFTLEYVPTSGRTAWSRRWDGGIGDGASALAITPDGSSVIVAGSSQSVVNGHFDYVTIAYPLPAPAR